MRAFWKLRVPFCAAAISVGLLILAWQSFEHYQAARRGPLVPFDDDGEHVGIPLLGVLCLSGGTFLLVLTSGRRAAPSFRNPAAGNAENADPPEGLR